MRAKNEELKEEVLEMLWVAEEDGRVLDRDGVNNLLSRPDGETDEVISELAKEGKLGIESSSNLELTSKGEQLARKIIRRHRLAERLLNDVLEMDQASIEGPACRFEHAISAEVEEKICTLLGHPDECPHGKAIPPGKCCQDSQELVSRAITPLAEVDDGQTVKIVYLTLSEEGRLSRLSSLGVLPGSFIKVDQKFPAFVIELEETRVAMEKEVANNIFVRNGSMSSTGTESEHLNGNSFLGRIKRKFSGRIG